MSLGGIPPFALERAVRRAVAADVIVLAAAGNCVQFVVWPARYTTNALRLPVRTRRTGPGGALAVARRWT